MATIDWPESLVPAKATWGLQSNTESFTSPLNRTVQTVERPGARWKANLEFPPLDMIQAGRLQAFLASLGGMAGRFTLWPHGRPGQSSFAPLVNGAMTDYRILPTRSWPASTLVLRAGDYVAVGSELKMVTADVTSTAGGLASVPVAPPFRNAPADGSALTLNKPRATMMLSSDEFAIATVPGRIAEAVVISAVEVLL
ncbi:hypothetical protein D9X30_3485 [Cupriavidus sp. U2]|uniref:hypothetical protein n=1 Tax=Cupriavidus sp. U2 TaxID=2920269 RepID=UPI00129EEDB3|nr:hypothetical protein [Cupriavidus sp. U2]KAI3591660.1 hypothetical protein D9X30_3485 [Cupriavidus sp. U2]